MKTINPLYPVFFWKATDFVKKEEEYTFYNKIIKTQHDFYASKLGIDFLNGKNFGVIFLFNQKNQVIGIQHGFLPKSWDTTKSIFHFDIPGDNTIVRCKGLYPPSILNNFEWTEWKVHPIELTRFNHDGKFTLTVDNGSK